MTAQNTPSLPIEESAASQIGIINTISIDNSVIGKKTITDSAGHASILTYDTSNGKTTSIKDPANNVYDFAYNTAGLLWKVTYPAPSTTESTRPYWEYLYNAAGLMEYKIDPARHIVRYEYDSQGRVQESTDPNGVLDTSGNVIAQGHTKSLVYTPATGVTTFTEKDGGTWIYTYDPQTMVLKEKTAPGGGIKSSFYYYPNLTLKASTKPYDVGKRLTTFYTYDAHGNRLTETEPVDLSVYSNPSIDPASVDVTTLANLTPPIKWAFIYTYDNNNHDQIKSKTDQRGATPLVTTYTYDYTTEPGVEIIKITDPENNVTTYRNNADGTPKSIIDANNVPMTYTYANGLLASLTDQDSVLTKYTVYDNNGNPKQIQKFDNTGKLIVTTDLTYDALNRLRTVTKTTTDIPPVITIAKYDYDLTGNLTVYTDPETNPTVKQTKYEYNYNGQVTKITDANQKETRFSYSGTGCTSCSGGVDKLTGVQDAKQLANNWPGTAYFYDQLGRLEHETNPRGKTIRYTYYDNDLVKDKIDSTSPGGEKTLITYTYNNRGQFLNKHYPYYPDVNGSNETFVYDANGRLQTATNQNISYTLAWYKNGWLQSVTDTTNNRPVSYEYDGAGNRTKLTAPDGISYYTYYNVPETHNSPPLNKPYSMDTPSGIFSLNYDNVGRQSGVTWGSTVGGTTNYTYDGFDRRKRINGIVNGGTFTDYSYTYDKSGNILTFSDASLGIISSYVYDNLYRLTSVTKNGILKESYQYDEVSNRKSGPTTATTYSYSQGNQLDSKTGNTYTYDDYGNLLTKVEGRFTYTYTYDAENRLTKVTKNRPPYAPLIFSFTYDPFGRRLTANYNRYTYDGHNILYEYGNTNSLVRRYVHNPGRIDDPLSYSNSNNNIFYYKDVLNSVKYEVTQSDMTSYGVDYNYTSSFGGMPTKFRIETPYAFTGREYDQGTGLYYYRARYYDPAVGRFIQRDPIGFAGGDVNLYGYVQNNPVNLIDPTGLDWFRPIADPSVVGRRGSRLVAPGKGIGKFIDDYVPAGHTFGTLHDDLVDMGHEAGLPDALINIPTMLGMYVLAVGTELDNSLYKLFRKKPLFVCH